VMRYSASISNLSGVLLSSRDGHHKKKSSTVLEIIIAFTDLQRFKV
jgi:hypothetical protein